MRLSRLLRQAGGLSVALLSSAPAFAAQWKTNVNYGGTTAMDLYVPDQVDASPAAVVAMHGCGATSAFAYDWLRKYSDQYGFVVIAPTAGGNCFDAAPVRSGEREAITKMVAYVIAQNKVDASRVYAVGASSGACMTNALMAAYPEVFAAGSVLAGVPAGSWNGGNAESWSTPTDRTAVQWGDIVRGAAPGFAGTRPRVQIWHGTGDTDLTYSTNFPAEVAQWTNVFGVSDANATKSEFKTAQDTWSRATYKNASGLAVLETNAATGAPHNLTDRGLWVDVVRFFALDADGSGGSGGSSAGGGGKAGSGNGGSSAAGGSGVSGAGGGATAGASGSSGVGGSGSGGNGMTSGSGTSAGGSSGGTSKGGAATFAGTSGLPGSAGNSPTAGAAPATGSDATHDAGGCSLRGAPTRATLAALAMLLALGLTATRRRRRAAARR